MGFTTYGIRFNLPTQKYKEYTSVLGIKLGKWKSYQSFSFLTILRSKQVGTHKFGGFIPFGRYEVVDYDIYLLNKTHLRRIMVGTYDDEEKANRKAQELAGALGMEMVRYNPAGSKRIRRR